MKETITIPEGVREIEISKCSDRVIIEFVPEEKKAIKPSDIFKIDEEKLLMAKITPELKMDFESTMIYITNRWIEETVKNGESASQIVLFPVPIHQIKDEYFAEYVNQIESVYQRMNVSYKRKK